MSPRDAIGVRRFSDLLAERAIPARVFGIQDLRHGHLAALTVVTSDVAEPTDADTVLRFLHAARSVPEMLALPIVLDLAASQLAALPPARNFSERPLIAVIEADELFDRPAAFVDAISRARDHGWEIGLRQVGASYRSLAALAVIEPALVVLDPGHVADSTSPLGIESIHAVTAYAQATGASVIAGHLDSTDALRRATRLAATLGWGSALRSATASTHETFELDLFSAPLQPLKGESCYEVAASRHRPQHTTGSVLEALSETIEQQAMATGPSTVVCVSMLHVSQIRPAMWRRYDALSRTAYSVTVLAEEVSRGPESGVTTIDLHPQDPLCEEWVVLALAPTSAVLLSARGGATTTPGRGRDFTFVLSYERELVAHAARSVFTRLGAAGVHELVASSG